MKKISFFILSCLVSPCFAQQGWLRVATIPDTNQYYQGFYFSSLDTGFLLLYSMSALGPPQNEAQEFTVHIPNDSTLLPPGYYYLFLVSIPGAPSIGQIVQIL